MFQCLLDFFEHFFKSEVVFSCHCAFLDLLLCQSLNECIHSATHFSGLIYNVHPWECFYRLFRLDIVTQQVLSIIGILNRVLSFTLFWIEWVAKIELFIIIVRSLKQFIVKAVFKNRKWEFLQLSVECFPNTLRTVIREVG